MTSLHERLVFDLEAGEIRDADRRYLLMRPDVLMGALLRLDAHERSRVLQAFADSTAMNGGKSLHAYLESAGATPDHLTVIVGNAAAALGWGRWTFDASAGTLRLAVRNSPFAAGFGPSDRPVCAPIAGLLRSVAENMLRSPVNVAETACAAQGSDGTCRFVAMRANADDPVVRVD